MATRSKTAIIVGSGVFGSSIAEAMTEREWGVTLVEQYAPANVRASSADSSRLLRMGHGTDDCGDWYTNSARCARELWRSIGEDEGTELFVECGVVWFARDPNGFEAVIERALRRLEIPVKRVAPDAAASFFPDVRTDDLAFVLYEPDAGVLRARTAVQCLVKRAIRHGMRIVHGRALPDGCRVRISTAILEADVVIWACGPWMSQIFPRLAPIRSAKQNVIHFGVDAAWRTPSVPAWLDGDAYGLGDLDGYGLKALYVNSESPDFDPDNGSRYIDRGYESEARMRLAHRFPSLAHAPVVSSHVCQYELTPDKHFVIAQNPEHPRVWLVGGGSGHGFKHGPHLGRYVADLIEGVERPRPEFGLHDRSSGLRRDLRRG